MKNKTGIIIGCAILGILLAFLFFKGGQALMALVFDKDDREKMGTEEEIDLEELDDEGMLKIQEGDRTNVLLLGIDAREGEEDARTDTMIFVSVDPKLKKAVIISIPRDTRVTIYGSRDQKICVANVYGGTDLAKKEVEELLHTHVDYYAKANFEGFAEIIDILGGVTIDIEQRMYHPATNPLENIDLQPGVQTLNGKDALSYVRFRSYAMGDIDRTAHQQKFLKALTEQITQPSTLLKIPKLLGVIKENLETDMPMSKIIQMASWAPLFDADNVVTQTLPGYFLDVRDTAGNLLNSFWAADEKVTPTLLNDLYEGKTYDTVNQVGGVTEVVGGTALGPAAEPAEVDPPVETEPTEEDEPHETVEENGLDPNEEELPENPLGEEEPLPPLSNETIVDQEPPIENLEEESPEVDSNDDLQIDPSYLLEQPAEIPAPDQLEGTVEPEIEGPSPSPALEEIQP